jgi:hypothetical protein
LFFFLEKKEPKIQSASWRKLQSFSRSKSLRNAAEKIVVRSLSPNSAALLPTYDKLTRIYFEFILCVLRERT